MRFRFSKAPWTPSWLLPDTSKFVHKKSVLLLQQLSTVFPGDSMAPDYPDILEKSGQS